MNKQLVAQVSPYFVAILIFLVLSAIYFSPQLGGKKLYQSDVRHFQGMSKEIVEFREKTGEEALWTNSMFGGMPAYQISVKHNNYVNDVKNLILRIIPRPIGYMFFLMIGFYIMLLCFKVDPWLAIIGAVAFGLASFNMLYLAAGHNSKVHAVSFIPPIIGGIFYAYRKNYVTGALILGVFVCLHIASNHLQMTYYLLYLMLAIVLFEFYRFFKEGFYLKFIKVSSVLLIAGILGVLPNFSNLLLTYEYGKFSTRGKSELTISAQDIEEKKINNNALDKGYIKQYSLGYGEVWSLVIPNVKGGRVDLLGNKKEVIENVNPNYRNTVAQQPAYWGEQLSSGGAFYYGASIFLLFLLGMFFVKDKIKWVLFATSLLAIILSLKYGNLVDWFIDNVPLYNKFRDTKMMLVIVQVSFPLLGILFLNKLFNSRIEKKKFLYISLGLGGLFLLFYMMPSVWFNFLSRAEAANFNKMLVDYRGNPTAIAQINDLKSEIIDARIIIFKQDVIRSLFFVAATALIIYLFIIKKIKRNSFIVVLGLLVLIDLWAVDRRYLNNDNFVSKRQVREPYQKTAADEYILQDKDPNFKVMNLTVSTFNDANTSYFHKSIGGYHGAKLKRYQELIEHQISKNNMSVLNMLNTKYFIVPDKNRQPLAQLNPDHLGHAWFVENFRIVANADEEIKALSDFLPATEAIIDQRFEDFVEGKELVRDTVSWIKLDSYEPNHLVYSANCVEEKLAIFPEIYYPKGWNVYIDGSPTDHFRANYILRAMVLPEGEHKIEFKFEPKSYYIGNKVSVFSSAILLIFLALALANEGFKFYKKKKE